MERPKNFLDARSSPKKFTVRKALRVYVHSARRREDTYLVLPLALSTVFSPTSSLLSQQQSLSSFCRFLLSTICAIWGVLGFALCLISNRYFLPRLHFSRWLSAIFSFALSSSLFSLSLFPAAIRASLPRWIKYFRFKFPF